jgi:DNA polymerase-1
MRDLTHHDIPTGVMFGLLRDIGTFQQEFSTTNIAFCFDGLESKRKEIYSGYKANREKKKSEMSEDDRLKYIQMIKQIKRLQTQTLPDMGFRNLFAESGYEADDLIASFVQTHSDTECIIVSADHDLYQCLTKRVSLWNPTRREIYRVEDYLADWRLSVRQWRMVKAIAGCSSDDIPGAPGIGEKTAAKFLRGEMKPSGKQYESIMESEKTIRRNLKLVTLPLPGTPRCESTTDQVDRKKWNKAVRDLGMNSLTRAEPRFRDG